MTNRYSRKFGFRNLIMTDIKNVSDQARREWIEPVVSELPVEDTAGFPGVGGDGGRNPDCTLS